MYQNKDFPATYDHRLKRIGLFPCSKLAPASHSQFVYYKFASRRAIGPGSRFSLGSSVLRVRVWDPAFSNVERF